MIGEYEVWEKTQLTDFYKMLKILKLTPMGFVPQPDLRHVMTTCQLEMV